jgi:hypothetical protein
MRSLPLVLVVAAGALVTSAEAQPRRYQGDGYVTAESRYSGKSISAPVRYGPRGRAEVRLPGGTWIECGRSCSDTLRRETIDFWDSRDPRGGRDGPGYLRFRF